MEKASESLIQDQLDIDIVKRRSVAGIIAITTRTLLLQGLALVANFLLTIFLIPSEYGIFFGVSALIDFLIIFSDVGLAAALIQKRDDITETDLRTTFTIQQILVNTLVILALIFSRPIGVFYGLSQEGIWLFRMLAISLTLASLKTIPSIKLERKLEFHKLIIPQIVENLFFYVTAVTLAWQGFGVRSFAWAVLLRGCSGLITMYAVSPWWPKLALNKSVLKNLFSFGAPFQLNTIIAFVKDKLLIAYLFKVLTPTQIGYLGWAQKWSLYPLQLVMDSVSKVTFPAYARLQNQKQSLEKAINKSLFFTSLLVFPMIIGLIAVAPSFVRLIPRYSQWQPALLALSFFCINSLWASISTTLTNTLAALGYIKTNLKLMAMWTTLTWISTPLLVVRYGYNGAAIASAIVACTSFVPIILVKRRLHINMAANTLPALATAIAVGIVAYQIASKTANILELLGAIAIVAILYAILNYLIQGKKLIHEFNSVWVLIRS